MCNGPSDTSVGKSRQEVSYGGRLRNSLAKIREF